MIPVKVITFDPETGDELSERTIDFARHSDRVWLGKHCFWAMHNGRGVETFPLENSNENDTK